ncbi:MAG: hypothetical protein AB8B83_00435 [Bdellovibrionales bacterium]
MGDDEKLPADEDHYGGELSRNDPNHPANLAVSALEARLKQPPSGSVIKPKIKPLPIVRMFEGRDTLGVLFPNLSVLGARVLRTFKDRPDLLSLAAHLDDLQMKIRLKEISADQFEISPCQNTGGGVSDPRVVSEDVLDLTLGR